MTGQPLAESEGSNLLAALLAARIRASGPIPFADFMRECDAVGSIPVGEAAITSGGKLRARFVIHAASMQLGGETTARALRSSTAHSLRIAAEKKLRSIAFPAIGTGIARFPLSECAQIMLREVVEHLKGPTSLELVYFVLFDAPGLAAFEKVWTEMAARGELEDKRAAERK